MKIAFDARALEKPPHSFRRVLRLLVDSALEMEWGVELWVEKSLRPEFKQYNNLVRLISSVSAGHSVDVMWSPRMEMLRVAVPGVATVHDINPLLPDDRTTVERWLRGKRFLLRIRRTFRNAWRVVTDSEYSRARLADLFPKHCDRLAVVPLYVSGDIKRMAREDRDRRLSGLGLSPGFVLFLGSLRRHKNWDGLVRAYAALPDSIRNEHNLVLAGSSHRAEKQVEKLVDILGVRRQVHVLGSVADDSVPALYSGALVFAFPSFMEGFGLPPLEAMACGVPVIAADRTSIPEILGDAPIYINPAQLSDITSAMLSVIEDRKLRERLIEAGLKRSSEFGVRRTGEAMRRVLS